MLSKILSTITNNLPDDQYRLLFSIVLSFPIGFMNNFIHGKTSRTLYSLIFGFIIQFYMYQWAVVHIFLSSLITLILIKFSDRKRVGWTTTIFAFSYLSILHIYRMITDYGGWSMDITLIFMSTVCKLSSFAFCYSDGEKDNLNSYKSKYAIKEFTLLEYFSYIYFYPTCIMGPFLEFADYSSYVKEEGDYKNIPKLIVFKNGLARLLLGFLFAAIYLSAKPYIGIAFFWENLGGKYVPDFLIYYSFYFQKYRYYTGFLFSESICYVSGVSYRKINQEQTNTQVDRINQGHDFQKVKNANILVCETTTNLSKFFQNWNISIHFYLKRYINFRVYDNDADYKDSGKASFAKTITFMVSGFWHGFYPSYYIIFSHFALFMATEDSLLLLKKATVSRGIFIKFGIKAIEYLLKFMMVTGACYMIGILDSLQISDMYKFMKLFNFWPSIVAVIVMVTLKILLKLNKEDLNKLKKK